MTLSGIYSSMKRSDGSLTRIPNSLLETSAESLLALGGRQHSLNWNLYGR